MITSAWGMSMALEFRLLGEVTVVHRGNTVDLGYPRQRCILAVLLVDVGQVVSVDALLDRVWGDGRPRRARNALSGYVSRLRQVLGACGEVRLFRADGGYRLVVDPMSVDLHRFRAHVATARAADDDQAALDQFEQALGLWRGPAFANVDTPWLRDTRIALNAEQFAAVLDRNDLALRLGRHAELLDRLPVWTDAHPLDERLAGQLMLALYHSGRQADALTQYEQLRNRLANELGADPTPPLQRLHQRILSADLALEDPAPSVQTPRQLPMAPQSFAGRSAELAALDTLLAPDADRTGMVAVVSGTGGVGKTWLALHWAQHNIERFPEGQLYVNLRGFDPVDEPVPPVTALRVLLDALGVGSAVIPADPDAQSALYRSLVANRRMLVILDDARDTTQVLPLLPGGSSCTVLITTRHQLGGLVVTHGARPLTLDVLGSAEARQLLVRRLGLARVDAEPDAATDLLRHCGGLPLALGIAAARASCHATLPLATFAAELRDATARLDALDTGEIPVNLRSVFSTSYRALDSPAATAFRLLGIAPGDDINLTSAAALIAAPVQPTRTILRELQSLHLVQQHVADRYRMHDLVRLHASELAGEDESRLALKRLLDHYSYAASVAADLRSPREAYRRPPIPEQAGPELDLTEDNVIDWLDTERPTLLAAAVHTAAHDQVPHLAVTLSRYLDLGGHHHDALALYTAALSVANGHELEPTILASRGATLTRLGRYDEALVDCRRVLAMPTINENTEAQVNSVLGIIRDALGERDEALDHFHRALTIARRAGHPFQEAVALYNLGDTYRKHGQHDLAAKYLDDAMSFGGLDRYVLASMGGLYQDQQDRALEHYGQALALARADTDRVLEAQILNSLGDLHNATNRAQEALAHHEEARALADEIHYLPALADAHHGIANSCHSLEQQARARHHAEAALNLYLQLGSPAATAARQLFDKLTPKVNS